MLRAFILAVMMCAASQAAADYKNRIIGNWLVSAEEDRFGDGGVFVALTDNDAFALAVRCLRKNLSLGVLDVSSDPNPLTTGESFKFAFRVDKNPVIETKGVAISQRMIQIETEKYLVQAIRESKETAVKIENASGVSVVEIFQTRGGAKAFADLVKECPLE